MSSNSIGRVGAAMPAAAPERVADGAAQDDLAALRLLLANQGRLPSPRRGETMRDTLRRWLALPGLDPQLRRGIEQLLTSRNPQIRAALDSPLDVRLIERLVLAIGLVVAADAVLQPVLAKSLERLTTLANEKPGEKEVQRQLEGDPAHEHRRAAELWARARSSALRSIEDGCAGRDLHPPRHRTTQGSGQQ